MPELPEVETVVRDLVAAGIVGARIREVTVRWPRTVAVPSPAAFRRGLTGRCLTSLSRRAKYLAGRLDDGRWLLLHLRMTGRFHIEAAGTRPDPHDRLVLTLEDGRALHFHDTRKFGRAWLVDDPAPVLGCLGPEPLDASWTAAVFRRELGARQARLKPLLLDQSFLAGLGNIYVDESLWLARLHPLRRAHTLSAAEARRLHRAIHDVLTRALAANGTTLGAGHANFYSVAGRRGRHADALRVFRRHGEPCPRCGRPIERTVVGQRGTHLCPSCQPAP
jgi:formamidopyrimidine-DNA glycosylase